MRWSSSTLMLVAVLLGCSKGGVATDARRMPQPPPVAGAQPPAALHIAVDADGRALPPIDARTLSTVPPDFKDADHRAWKLTTLLGAAVHGASDQIAVVGESSVAVVFPQPATPGDEQPVLMVNRRGEIVATMLSPAAPFPDFHHEGGRLHRPGDPTPHVVRVQAIHVHAAPPGP